MTTPNGPYPQSMQDFYELMAAYLERAAANNVVRAEIFFDPQTHRANGVPFETFFEGFHSAIQVRDVTQMVHEDKDACIVDVCKVSALFLNLSKVIICPYVTNALAKQDAEKESGISADLIMCFLRHEGAQPAWDTLQEVRISFPPSGQPAQLECLGAAQITQSQVAQMQ